jgi:hypothetical protein
MFLRRLEDVDQSTANGELAAPLDEMHPPVRGRGRPALEVLERDLVTDREGTGSRSASPPSSGCSTARTGATMIHGRLVVGVLVVRMDEPWQHDEPAPDGVAAR